MDALARLDRWLGVGADDHVAGLKQLALPAAGVEVKHPAGLLQEVGVARKDPRLVAPRADRVISEPAPDRRRRRLADGLLDDEAVDLRSTEARQRQPELLGQLARDRLDLRDLLRGENDAGDRTALCPQDPRCLRQRTVFASPRRDRRTYPRAERSRDWSDRQRRAAPVSRGPRPCTPTSGWPPDAQVHDAPARQARSLSPRLPRHNVRQPPAESFTSTTELPAGST
jgi:hypothetical protein